VPAGGVVTVKVEIPEVHGSDVHTGLPEASDSQPRRPHDRRHLPLGYRNVGPEPPESRRPFQDLFNASAFRATKP